MSGGGWRSRRDDGSGKGYDPNDSRDSRSRLRHDNPQYDRSDNYEGIDPPKRPRNVSCDSDSSEHGHGSRGYGDRDRDRDRDLRSRGYDHGGDNEERDRSYGRRDIPIQGSSGSRDRSHCDFDSPGGRGGGHGRDSGNGDRDSEGNRGGRGRGRGRGRDCGNDGDLKVDIEEGRGARRGQRFDRNDKFDLVRSRPETMIGEGSKRGNSGQPVQLIANFFPLIRKPTWCLYNYRVDYKPEEDRIPFRKALLRVHGHNLGGGYIFDGSNMWTSHRIFPEPLILYSMRESDNVSIEVTVRLVAEMHPGDVTYLQFYNIIVRKCLQILKFEELGRHFYDRNAAISMPQQRLELWPGYITTMRNYEYHLMLCVEVTHKVLRLDTALDVMRSHRSDFRKAVADELIGTVVMTHYNRKTYKIDDIDWDLTPLSTFEYKSNKTTYQDYYERRYGAIIKNLSQPMLVSRPKKRDIHRGQTGPIVLVPEFCQMTGLTDQIRNNFNTMRELARHLHQPPDRRIDNIRNFMRRLRASTEINEELTKWGLEFDGNLVTIPGRILPKDQIIMMTGGKVDAILPDDQADWKFAFRNKNMFSNVHLSKWVILVTQRDACNVDNLIQTMTNVGRTLGFRVEPPLEIFRLPDTRIQGYIGAINQAMANHRGNLDILFVILPSNKLDLYAAIKKRCCVDFGIPSQCFLGKNMNNPRSLMSIATKVVIQINAKLGGEPWAITNPLKTSYTMVVGFDVYHCGKRKGASVGAMVATTNKELSRYYSTVSFHGNKEELSGNLCTDLTKCLYAFQEVNDKNLPDRIIMFRDGVGEGQLTYVYNSELEQMKRALRTLYSSVGRPPARFTLIIVTKKINSRIVTAGTSHGGQSKNPTPGTVVDDIITLPERWDFFLISQYVNQGTVSPTSYNVIFDQQGLDPDKIQRFTFKMTHMYYNWSGTVAVPAPCQYAHKLAYLTGLALGNASHERLSHLLYYL